jgi:UDP-N-acetylglucosamine 2-epimerase (non-hydrolysing)/GDP/UDP-N,N'-diacetylbacillosamine 2-epimerase (hydrolysing)
MGEEPWRVHLSGAPSLDHLHRSKIPNQMEIVKQFNLDKDLIVVAYHPVTLYKDSTQEQDSLFAALQLRTENIVFCFPNADTGSHKIMKRVYAFCELNSQAQIHTNLSAQTYWGLLTQANLMIGNSSSGIMETASLKLPTINIGIRQKGREQAKNIIDVDANTEEISSAIDKALSTKFIESLQNLENPYGDGQAAEKIYKVLSEIEINDRLLFKKNIL